MREPTGSWPTAQGTVRDVVRATVSDGSVTSVAAIDHVFYDVFGQQDVPQTAGSGQASTQVGFQGMLIDPLAGFNFVVEYSGGSGGGSGSYTLADSATGLYYSAERGFYDSVSETNLTGAAGDASGAGNPYEFEGDAPTGTGIVMADPPENSASPVGVMQSSGEGPDFAEYGSGVPVDKSPGSDWWWNNEAPGILLQHYKDLLSEYEVLRLNWILNAGHNTPDDYNELYQMESNLRLLDQTLKAQHDAPDFLPRTPQNGFKPVNPWPPLPPQQPAPSGGNGEFEDPFYNFDSGYNIA